MWVVCEKQGQTQLLWEAFQLYQNDKTQYSGHVFIIFDIVAFSVSLFIPPCDEII